MPLATPEDHGSEADGQYSKDYCVYCYNHGAFVAPELTIAQMRDFCIDKMVERDVMPRDQATNLMTEVMPRLRRWRMASPRT